MEKRFRQEAGLHELSNSAQADQVSVALALHEQMQPVVERTEDVILGYLAKKQADSSYQARDSRVLEICRSSAARLLQPAEEVPRSPHTYATNSTKYMRDVISYFPELIADIFVGYEPVDLNSRWTNVFADAALSDKWERMIVAALHMEDQGLPRPKTIEDLITGAIDQDLYRY